MNLFWLERLRKDVWTYIDVSKIDEEEAIVRIGSASPKVKEREFVKIDDSLTGDEFSEFDFAISRQNLSSDKFSIKLTISSPSNKPLDRWLVQLLDKTGREPHRTCRRKTNRIYGLKESVDGTNKLLEITHEFVVDREAFKEGAILGIANLDEIKKTYSSLPAVEFSSVFSAMD